jgi:hypothetical protein
MTYRMVLAARAEIVGEGLIALYRASTIWGAAIAWGTRSDYCHAGLVSVADGVIIESVEGRGVRETTITEAASRNPGLIDIYRVAGVYDPQEAIAAMRSLTGMKYGWKNLLATAVRHMPLIQIAARIAGVRLFPSGLEDSQGLLGAPNCSAAVAFAVQHGGVDLVRRLSVWAVTPGDIARSPLVDYCCTLV